MVAPWAMHEGQYRMTGGFAIDRRARQWHGSAIVAGLRVTGRTTLSKDGAVRQAEPNPPTPTRFIHDR